MNQPSLGVVRPPGEILFGEGQRFAVGRAAVRLGDRALICTDARFAGTDDMRDILDALAAQKVKTHVFDGVAAELPASCVQDCLNRLGDWQPSLVIGIGGGSCVDHAKLVALALAYPGGLDAWYGELKVPGPILPVIAIPTTSGTGSEVTPVAVLGDSSRDLKIGISSPYLIPRVAICDPDLTVTCPPGLTALSGADALTHAIEAFTAVRHEVSAELPQDRVFIGKNLFSDQFALQAIRAISGSLAAAVRDGSNRHARRQLMYGSLMAGLAFGVAGTAAAHAIQYPVGAITGTAHGLGVAALLPYVMAYNADACMDELVQVAQALGADVAPGASAEEHALAAISHVRSLCSEVGIPRTLAELGVTEDRLGWIAAQSMMSARLINNNPRPLDEAAVRHITDNAFHGRLTAFETSDGK